MSIKIAGPLLNGVTCAAGASMLTVGTPLIDNSTGNGGSVFATIVNGTAPTTGCVATLYAMADPCVFNGYISGTALTVTHVASGALAVGQTIFAAGSVIGSTFIVSGSGSSWVLNQSQTVFSSGAPGSLNSGTIDFVESQTGTTAASTALQMRFTLPPEVIGGVLTFGGNTGNAVTVTARYQLVGTLV